MTQPLPKVIIHGGAGSSVGHKERLVTLREDLYDIVNQVYSKAEAGASARDCVVLGCQLMEDSPHFNAGYGSVLQSDGQVRMSAGLMDGDAQRFSGIINVSRVRHPIDLAAYLQPAADRVLSDLGAAELAREMGLVPFDPVTDLRLKEWMRERANNFQSAMAGVVAETVDIPADPESRRGTIGVVVLDTEGRLAAGTSTGGKGLERLGRVSDSATPAGNYANALAAVSCTGIGEDILDECLAARIVVRVSDGMDLLVAFEKSFAEATAHGRDFGAIALSHQGQIAWGKTSEVLIAAYHTGDAVGDTLDLDSGTLTGVV
ncbi:isoaspartyl peptidase/L-asparaginase [Nodosilinea sp. PGN35]|uniref:isoaspartyl peptidase/L-asparaginase n=1 Tax=Nodosilinea sp. PGN35 TaxID=3020489 RepID=UPI0023B245C1|nr:isoaspartyl peptidase/L-asparaginase [Nodosilinea sp. TSF1-S3]MDF0366204.1 isoaspartyl peptidase/L-asparaginase [Nodosilinea sp. TSF1-S3]